MRLKYFFGLLIFLPFLLGMQDDKKEPGKDNITVVFKKAIAWMNSGEFNGRILVLLRQNADSAKSQEVYKEKQEEIINSIDKYFNKVMDRIAIDNGFKSYDDCINITKSLKDSVLNNGLKAIKQVKKNMVSKLVKETMAIDREFEKKLAEEEERSKKK